jgi:hypothetical protein
MDSPPRPRGAVVAAMEVKHFIEESLRLKQCTVIVSLYIKVAFDTAWWPSILKQLRDVPGIYTNYQPATLVAGK